MNQEVVNEYFEYKEGKLYWKKTTGPRSKVGSEAGNLNNTGYLRLKFRNKKYLIHRLIYLYHYGYLPKYLDHINQNKLDNRIENLRPATKSENGANRCSYKGSTSKYKGVSWHKRIKKWSANITKDNKKYHLGYYLSEEEAAKNYDKAARELHNIFCNLNIN